MSENELSEAVVAPEVFFKKHAVGPDKSSSGEQEEEREPLIVAQKPSEFINWEMPEGHLILGDNQIIRGEVFLIGGTQGVGKSRAVAALALSGATGEDWMGHKTHTKFKTLIVQNENGNLRLKDELTALQAETDVNLDDFLLVTPIPAEGLNFQDAQFRDDLREILDSFKPDVVVLDPWNAVAEDNTQKAYGEAYRVVKSGCLNSDSPPAIGIVAHVNKPNVNDKKGRGAMNRVSGSHLLVSVPRCVWMMDSVTDDITDNRVILTNPKSSNGMPSPRSAWMRTAGLYQPLPDFDWTEYDGEASSSSAGRNPKHSDEDYVRILPPEGLTYSEFIKAAKDELGVGHATAERALKRLSSGDDPLILKSVACGRYQPIRRGGNA
jgi:hypothetical protein